MNEIVLGERTEETVRIYFEKAKQPVIKAMLPQKAQTVEEALEDFKKLFYLLLQVLDVRFL